MKIKKLLAMLLLAALMLSPTALTEGEPVAEARTDEPVSIEESTGEDDETPTEETGGEIIVEPAEEAALEAVEEMVSEEIEVDLVTEEAAAEAVEAEAAAEALAADEPEPVAEEPAEFAAEEPGPEPEAPAPEVVVEEGATAEKAMAAEGEIPIDAAHFPDAGFRDFIAQTCDSDMNGSLSEGERFGVYSMVLSTSTASSIDAVVAQKNITITPKCHAQSLEGIQYFPKMIKLECEGIGLTGGLDLRQNPELQFVYCFDNQLTSLDITNCPNIMGIVCQHNNIGSLSIYNKPQFNTRTFGKVKLRNKRKDISVYQAEDIVSGSIICDNKTKLVKTAPNTPASGVEQVSVAGKSAKATVNAGATFQINPGATAGKKFKSSKKKVATVDSNGIVTAKAKGKTKITFKVGKKTRKLVLTVNDPTIPTSVTLSQSGTVAVKKGDTVTLNATIPEGTNSAIKWKSSNKKVATVNNGVVTFKKKGKVTITATAVHGKKKAKVKFKVSK